MFNSFQAFRSLIDHSPDVISVVDVKGEILFGSASTLTLLGYEPAEIVGRNCLELIHPEDREHSIWALNEVLKSFGPLQWDVRIRHKDGRYRWVESTVSNLVFESNVRAIVMHQRDIEARRAAEIERQVKLDELARSNERLEEFAYIAAHDLREPLRAISAHTELLAQELELDASAKQMAKFIVDGTTRMSKLIDNLLSFAASGKHDPPRDVNLNNVVSQAIDNLEFEIRRSGARVTVDSLPIVTGDETQLLRLFQNLIANAAKYRSSETPEIRVSAEQHNAEWVIAVKDNGVGIAPKDQDRVFMPFFRVAEGGVPGTGLGLAVCKKNRGRIRWGDLGRILRGAWIHLFLHRCRGQSRVGGFAELAEHARVKEWMAKCLFNPGERKMPLINLVIVLIVVGMALYAINRYIPMASSIKTILNIVVVVAVCVWVLQTAGLWTTVTSYKIGR